MADATATATSARRNPLALALFTILGALGLLLGWAIFAYYRVHHVGLAL